MDLNGATMKSFASLPVTFASPNEVTNTTNETQGRTIAQKLGDFFKRGGEVPTNLE
jgi:hypothetical protein